MATERQREIKRRRHRRNKVRKLKAKLAHTTDPRQRRAVIAKIKKVSYHAPVPEV